MDNLFLITGNDDFAIKTKTQEIITSLCGPEPESNPALEIIHGDSDELKPKTVLSEFLNSINTPAFLGSHKTAWLKHFAHFESAKSKEGEKRSGKNEISDLVDFINGGIPDDLNIVIDGPNLDRRSSIFKACQKHGQIFYFEKLDLSSRNLAESLSEKISDFYMERNMRISQDAVDFLIESVGSDTGRLYCEMEKLSCYVSPNNSISLEDCQNICSRTPETAGWALADTVAERNTKQAFKAINTLVDQIQQEKGRSNPELSILNTVIKRFQDIIGVKTDAVLLSLTPGCSYPQFRSSVESPPPDIKAQLKNSILIKSHPYRAWKLFNESRNFTDQELSSALSVLLELNRQLVSGTTSPRIMLEQIVMKICPKKKKCLNRISAW